MLLGEGVCYLNSSCDVVVVVVVVMRCDMVGRNHQRRVEVIAMYPRCLE